MKKNVTVMFALTIILTLTSSLIAQSVGDYRTRASGGWSMAQNWQRYNGAAWVNAGTPPTGSETITVLSTDSVNVNVAVSITGKLINQGIVEPDTNLSVANGGTYQHDRDGGRVPLAIWEDGSTMLVTGVTAVAPNDRDQNYYNLTFDTPNLGSNLHMNLNNNTIRGNIRVINTGATNRWYLTSTTADSTRIVTIMGDVIVEAGAFSVQGTSNARTTFIVHHYGNIVVTGGNFSVARGSQGSGTGSTRWYLHEGNFSMSNATTQNSNATNAWFVFDKAGTQTLTLGAGNTLTALPIEVSSGTTLDMGASALAGSGLFTLNEGATLMTALAGGISEIFSATTGTVTLAEGSSYGFNGTTAQVTSSRMPTTVTDLIIDNPAGVTLSQATTINGVLRLKDGVFDNTIPFTLGPNGSISNEGGSLKLPVSVESRERNLPESFFIEQNYPNPFWRGATSRSAGNPATTLRFGLPSASHVTVEVFNMLGQKVATLFDGHKDAGVHDLLFEAANLSSGMYLYRIQTKDAVSIKRMVLGK